MDPPPRPRAAGAARLAAAALLLAGCAGLRTPPAHPLVGREVAVEAPDLEGRRVRVADQAGTVRVVDFWATWCEPCREQLPHLDQLAQALGARGLRAFAVSVDADRAQLAAWLQEHPVAFPVLWDPGGDAHAERLELSRLPTTLVIDRAGRVRFVHVGYDRAGGMRLEREVEALLAEGGDPGEAR